MTTLNFHVVNVKQEASGNVLLYFTTVHHHTPQDDNGTTKGKRQGPQPHVGASCRWPPIPGIRISTSKHRRGGSIGDQSPLPQRTVRKTQGQGFQSNVGTACCRTSTTSSSGDNPTTTTTATPTSRQCQPASTLCSTYRDYASSECSSDACWDAPHQSHAGEQ